ncbi:midasin-like [Papaver somniferum]|uniref:midasin-like n=1 Tax=Papaver somniferum TaxID=3469 RepID=UPI000E6FC54E|nr:midasin-like [Papaver somniferum]
MDDKWIDYYFESLSLRIAHDGSPKQLIYPRSVIKEPSIDLESSLKMFFQKAACVADDWTDVNTKYGDRRSFPRFLRLLETSGLEKYASNEDNDINDISYQPNRWLSLQASTDDVVIADKYYDGSLSLKQLLQRICPESGDDFRRKQAGLLESFLDHLIKVQQEQRVVAYSFFEHLEQLRESVAVAFFSDTVDSDGDRHKCLDILCEHSRVSCLWKQKHLLDNLCFMSRGSAWLLKQLKDSRFTSPSSIKESNKILDILLEFISKFKKSKESLDQYLLDDECCPTNVALTHLVACNNEILDSFRERLKNLQEQGVERKSVAETLLGCFVDVVNMKYNRAERGNPSRNTCSSLRRAFSEAAKETSEMINEAVEKLNSVRGSDLTGGGSPLGSIVLWRIIFESSLINLRLDCICENFCETVKLGLRPFDTATSDQLDQIRLSIDELLTVGKSVLVEFIAMHKTVAEVSFILGDAFTTGGELSGDVRRLGTSSRNVDQFLMDFDPNDFPWDKHVVHDYFKINVDDPKTREWMKANPNYGEYVGRGLCY